MTEIKRILGEENDLKDPFAHHPELVGKIVDHSQSFFRTFDMDAELAAQPDLAWVREKLFSDDFREENRLAALDGKKDQDLWIFGYGSLMWDPAFVFSDVRRANVPGYARQFLLKETFGGRGSVEQPGLMAALAHGDNCQGLAFRIPQNLIDVETEILWRREMIAPGYVPTFVETNIDGQDLEALTFVVDYSAPSVAKDLTHEEQVQYISTGTGMLGSSADYLRNIVSQFEVLGITDPHCANLLADVEAFIKMRQG